MPMFTDATLVKLYAAMAQHMAERAYLMQVQLREVALSLPTIEVTSRRWTHEYLASLFGSLIGDGTTLARAIEACEATMADAENGIEYRIPQSCVEVSNHYRYRECYKASCILRDIAGLPHLPFSPKLA